MLSKNLLGKLIQIRKYSFKIGDKVSMNRRITEDDVKLFANLTHDYNPIHFDPEKGIVHGAFLNGLVSAVIGTILPGFGTVVVKQVLKFPKPCYVGSEVTVNVKVISIRKLVEVEFQVVSKEKSNQEQVFLEGNAKLLTLFPQNLTKKLEKEINQS